LGTLASVRGLSRYGAPRVKSGFSFRVRNVFRPLQLSPECPSSQKSVLVLALWNKGRNCAPDFWEYMQR